LSPGFFVWSFKTRVEYGFLQNPPVEGTVNSMEQKTRDFCQIHVQEFYPWNAKILLVSLLRNLVLDPDQKSFKRPDPDSAVCLTFFLVIGTALDFDRLRRYFFRHRYSTELLEIEVFMTKFKILSVQCVQFTIYGRWQMLFLRGSGSCNYTKLFRQPVIISRRSTLRCWSWPSSLSSTYPRSTSLTIQTS
jgi:hypothetical protein